MLYILVHSCEHLCVVFRLQSVICDVICLGHVLLTLLDKFLELRPLNFVLAQSADIAFVDAVFIVFYMLDLCTLVALLSHLIDELQGIQ